MLLPTPRGCHTIRHMLAFALATLAVALLALAGCGASSTGTSSFKSFAATQTASATGCQRVGIKQDTDESFPYFEPSSCIMSAGSTVTFMNQSHIDLRVFLGMKQQFVANPNGPSALDTPAGVTINAGKSADFTFAQAGTFTITGAGALAGSLAQPNLDMTVTVTGG